MKYFGEAVLRPLAPGGNCPLCPLTYRTALGLGPLIFHKFFDVALRGEIASCDQRVRSTLQMSDAGCHDDSMSINCVSGHLPPPDICPLVALMV